MVYIDIQPFAAPTGKVVSPNTGIKFCHGTNGVNRDKVPSTHLRSLYSGVVTEWRISMLRSNNE